MGVLWCREKYGNEAERTADTGRYRRLFFVRVADAQADREYTIINSPEVGPLLSGVWEAGTDRDTTVRVNGFRLRQLEEHPELYELEIDYESLTGEDDEDGGPNTDPLLEPPEFEYTWASSKRIVQFVFEDAITDNPDLTPEQQGQVRLLGALTSAKEPFDPQPEIDDDRMVLTITINQAVYNARLALLYANSVNADPFSGAQPGQCLMKPWRARRQFKNGITYWRVTYEIHFRIDGWLMKLLDQGSYYYVGGYTNPGATKEVFRDEQGHPTTGLLDGTGDKLDAGGTQVKLLYNVYHKTIFGVLGLPIPN